MWKYDVRDVPEDHYRALRLLIQLNRAEAHLLVICDPAWPPRISYRRGQQAPILGVAIN